MFVIEIGMTRFNLYIIFLNFSLLEKYSKWNLKKEIIYFKKEIASISFGNKYTSKRSNVFF